MAELDLDQERAVRAEQMGEPHTIKYAGQAFTIPASPPWDLMEDLGVFIGLSQSVDSVDQADSIGALSRAMEKLLGEAQWEAFRASDPRPDQGTVFALVNGITSMYGLGDLGEAPGSAESSQNIGEKPRPTSNGSTPSTSGEPVTATSG